MVGCAWWVVNCRWWVVHGGWWVVHGGWWIAGGVMKLSLTTPPDSLDTVIKKYLYAVLFDRTKRTKS